MQSLLNRHYILCFALFTLVLGDFGKPLSCQGQEQGLFLQDQLDQFGDIQSGDPVSVTTSFQILTGTRQGILKVTADIIPNWHVFSMKDTNGPIPTNINVGESDDFKLLGKFRPDREPHIVTEEGFDDPCEEFENSVSWSAPFEIASEINPDKLVINLVINGQACETNGSCKPFEYNLESKFGGVSDALAITPDFIQPKLKIEDQKVRGAHAEIRGQIIRNSGTDKPLRPGDVARLEITITPEIDWHVYSYSLEKTQIKSTILGLTQTNSWNVVGPKLSAEPEAGEAFGEPVFAYYEPVTLDFFISIPRDAKKNQPFQFNGIIGLQTCDETHCDPPTGIAFSALINLGKAAAAPLIWTDSTYESAENANKPHGISGGSIPADNGVDDEDEGEDEAVALLADSPEQIEIMKGLYDPNEKQKIILFDDLDEFPVGSGGSSSLEKTTFITALLGAFFGGMLLNLMPCVFPVLGLKVMGFVMQAGSEPAKIRKHGIAFAFGLVVSMWILGGAVLFVKLSFGEAINWGAQMGNPYFVCGIIVLLFLLGLNMAGVFEIGTSLSGVDGGQKKGYTGSFFSGVLTTLIATPCSGPFLGAAMSYTLAQDPLPSMFLFTVFALGISSPYLVLSFFPALIYKLPKPGPWMETFKATMAFTLFATVAFFMQAFGGQTGVGGLSWLVMALVVIALAAYCYGQWGEASVKLSKRLTFGYLMPLIIASIGIWMCYGAVEESKNLTSAGAHNVAGLGWQEWNPGKVEYALKNNGRPIWVDYTADW
ncbi:MAG: protein-disulfide reductase DsbD family protein [Mariniblastus sp.]